MTNRRRAVVVMKNKYQFYKKKPGDSVWWLFNRGIIGEFVFSFDKEKTYNLFRDYPDKLSKEERKIFNKENPEWAEFFKERNAKYTKERKEPGERSDAVDAYRERRKKRVEERKDADDGRWVTTENDNKIHISKEGIPDKGNPYVLAAANKEFLEAARDADDPIEFWMNLSEEQQKKVGKGYKELYNSLKKGAGERPEWVEPRGSISDMPVKKLERPSEPMRFKFKEKKSGKDTAVADADIPGEINIFTSQGDFMNDHVFYHEMGHQLSHLGLGADILYNPGNLWGRLNRKKHFFESPYGNLHPGLSPEESFADLFADYIGNPERVKSKAPDVYNYFSKLTDANPWIREWVKESYESYLREAEKHERLHNSDAVEAYRARRKARLDAKRMDEDDEEGRWITTENGHKVHLNEEGEPDKGNPHVIEVMEGGADIDVSKEHADDIRRKMFFARDKLVSAYRRATWDRKRDLDYALGWKDRMDKWNSTKSELLKQIEDEYYGGDESKMLQRAEELKKEAEQAETWDETLRLEREARNERNKPNELKKIRERLRDLDFLMEREKNPPSKEELKKLRDDYDSAVSEFDEKRSSYERLTEERRAIARKRFPTVSKCKSTDDVEDYLIGKGYYSGVDYDEDYGSEVNLGRMRVSEAKKIAKRIDGIMKDYPFMVGRTKGIKVNGNPGRSYAHADYKKMCVEFGERWINNPKELAESWEECRRTGFHPDYEFYGVADHEYIHMVDRAITEKLKEKGVDRRASDIVAEAVCKRLNDGKRSDEMEDLMRVRVSEYSYENDNVGHENGKVVEKREGHGVNTEFLAEAVSEARCCKAPREIARMAQEELNKLAKEVFG